MNRNIAYLCKKQFKCGRMETIIYNLEYEQGSSLHDVADLVEEAEGHSVFYISYRREDVEEAIENEPEMARQLGVQIYKIEGDSPIYLAF